MPPYWFESADEETNANLFLYGVVAPAMTVVLQPGRKKAVELPIVSTLTVVQINAAYFAESLTGSFFIRNEPNMIPP